MSGFMLRFLISNLFISGIIGILLLMKWLFRSILSPRMQYRLWFLLLGLLAVPFIPLRPIEPLQLFSWLRTLNSSAGTGIRTDAAGAVNTSSADTLIRLKDFTVNSVSSSHIGTFLFVIWIAGILIMIRFMVKSLLQLHTLRQSALPLQNPEIRTLYHNCLREAAITKVLPVYSTAFLKSPVFTGLLKPCIYLPIHLISDYRPSDMRYMLLHELQHYRHRDNLAGLFMNLAGIIYWFNPTVWYALAEMRSDRETACDTSVLELLEEASYADYGNTLLHFAEKVSLRPFPFSAGLGGTMKQMKRRILNIASYRKPTQLIKAKGAAVFSITAALLLCLSPILSTYAADNRYYKWDTSGENISTSDLSAYFDGFEGSFVLYDLEENHWDVYNMQRAVTRTSPNSTYKLYDALFALEEGIITPEDSLLSWDGTAYPFEEWNQNQTLQSAMTCSVNWYFQTLDQELGKSALRSYIQKIGYGNEQINGSLSAYWLESSLKISPLEQVQLLSSLHRGSFGFKPENIFAVKNAIRLSKSEQGTLYGKTGTGQVNGQNVNGWFIGFVEADEHTCFFAVNITGSSDASGSRAFEITLSLLSDMNIWHN